MLPEGVDKYCLSYVKLEKDFKKGIRLDHKSIAQRLLNGPSKKPKQQVEARYGWIGGSDLESDYYSEM